jgi:hypothetical protein
MSCSSLNLDRFIVRPPSGGRTLSKSGGVSGAQVTSENRSGGIGLSDKPLLGFERKCRVIHQIDVGVLRRCDFFVDKASISIVVRPEIAWIGIV